MRIATHNSGTGEKSNWRSFFFAPFAKCQSKTLAEQYKVGVRLFDIRVVKYKDVWYFAHGLWRSKEPVCTALRQLNLEAYKANDKVLFMVTYEGECESKLEFITEVKSWNCYNYIEIIEINAKKPEWKTYLRHKKIPYIQCFRVLDFSTLHTLLPIPWLWAKLEDAKWAIKAKRTEKNTYKMFDFI